MLRLELFKQKAVFVYLQYKKIKIFVIIRGDSNKLHQYEMATKIMFCICEFNVIMTLFSVKKKKIYINIHFVIVKRKSFKIYEIECEFCIAK